MRLLASSRSYAHRSGIDVYVQSDVRSDTLSHGLPPLTLQIVAFGRSVCGSAHLGAQRTIPGGRPLPLIFSVMPDRSRMSGHIV
jgi:hypothetical protein